MRIEPFTVGDYIHVYNRGNRKAEIVRSEEDRWRFMQALRFFNDSHSSQNILRDILITSKTIRLSKSNFDRPITQQQKEPMSVFETGWPQNWPEKDPLVKILCYCLMPNHFHLLLKEIKEGGVSRFMQKLGGGYTKYFNIKHKEVGRLFQGSYKGRTVKNDQSYLEYLSVYIQVVNALELYPGGHKKALENIDKALDFVQEYSFSSYQDFIGLRKSLIIDKDIFEEIFPSIEIYKEFVRDVINGRKYEVLEELKLEN